MNILYTTYSSLPGEIIAFFILIMIMFVVPIILVKKVTEPKAKYVKRNYEDYPTVSDKTLRSLGFENKDQLTHKLEKLFNEQEKAIGNHDTKKLKEICVTTLFNEINSIIKEQKNDQIKNALKNIKITKRKITQISKVDTRIEIKMLIGTQTIKYQEIKGNKCEENEYNDLYLVYFIKDDITNDGRTDECKNCGAPVKNGETTCPYCDRKTGNIRKYNEWSIKDKQLLT